MRSRRRNVIAVLSDDSDGAETEPDAPAPRRKKSSGKRRKPVRLELETDDPGIVYRARKSLKKPKTILIVAVGLGLITGVPWLASKIPALIERDEYKLASRQIEITPPPRNVPPDLVDQVVQQSKLPDEISLLESDVSERLAQAFAGHPWVARVVEIRKSFPPRVQVKLEYREPIAMIEVADGWFPVDTHGVVLPPKDFSAADRERFPLIRGVRSRPKGSPGRRWTDPAVASAVKLSEQLLPHWKELELTAIVIPEGAVANAKDTKYELHTADGSRILWGRAPGTNHPGELTVEQKIARLKKYRADFGRFDKPSGPYEIDIRHWREITRRPIAAANTGERH